MLKTQSVETFATLEKVRCPHCGKASYQRKKETIWYCLHYRDVDLWRNWVREEKRQ